MENNMDRAVSTGDREAFKKALLGNLDRNDMLRPSNSGLQMAMTS